ncbi:MAG: hypothetical protein Q4A66_01860 [Eubacteriales bacterium]|nr:hypothetical protein [Eubacteriales bacterium]
MKTNLRILLVSALLLLTTLCLPACAQEAPAAPSLTERLFLLFGGEEAAVLEALGSPEAADAEERGAQRTLHIALPEGSAPASARLTFYNGVLMACEYTFEGHEAALLHAQACLTGLQEHIGEMTTYPAMSADGKARLNTVEDLSALQEMYTYYEDWTPEVPEEVVRRMLGDTEPSRIDLRLELSVYPEELAVVSMKYMAIRSSLQ